MFDFKKIPCKCENAAFRSVDDAATTTCSYFPPVYDRKGNNLNPDRNLVTQTFKCTVCNRRWNLSNRGPDTETHVLEIS